MGQRAVNTHVPFGRLLPVCGEAMMLGAGALAPSEACFDWCWWGEEWGGCDPRCQGRLHRVPSVHNIVDVIRARGCLVMLLRTRPVHRVHARVSH